MNDLTLIGLISVATAGVTIAIGSVGPALGEGRALAQALGHWRSSPTNPAR